MANFFKTFRKTFNETERYLIEHELRFQYRDWTCLGVDAMGNEIPSCGYKLQVRSEYYKSTYSQIRKALAPTERQTHIAGCNRTHEKLCGRV